MLGEITHNSQQDISLGEPKIGLDNMEKKKFIILSGH
jgi:hypothetical protein